ncbi:MAG TPA: sigma-54 dependent transcriptional regulator, partial [Vicinamibacteria bacterium]|nr:sigma-54 dependent transcriptional regulator [Vicinamibacteria bacterium]
LHAESPRADAAFVVVDCAALHEELLQSEIFGHEKGAFTGAARRKHGLFEVANGGTIFLDEVGDTSPDIQAKLLRVLENGRFRHLGGTEEITVDVRVVAATNRDLRQAIARGHFREDLFYRLATFTVEIPPLRERREDVRLLVEHFTERVNARFSLAKRFSAEATDALVRYAWPGNVRELLHTVEQTVVLCDSEAIALADLPPAIRASAAEPVGEAGIGEMLTLREVERRHIYSVLAKVGGNRAQAARILGTSERSCYRLLEKHRRASARTGPEGEAPPNREP